MGTLGEMAFAAAAVWTGREAVFEQIPAEEIDLWAPVAAAGGQLPLEVAVGRGHFGVARCLLEHEGAVASSATDVPGSDLVNVSSPVSMDTPVMVAVRRGDAAMTRLLIEFGADETVVWEDGWQSIHHAAAAGNEAIVYTLCEARRSVAERMRPLQLTDRAEGDRYLEDALVIAMEHRKAGCAVLLVEAGADVDADTGGREGSCMLAFAVRQGLLEVVRALTAHGAEVDRREGADQETPLLAAVAGGASLIARALLEAGADANACYAPPAEVGQRSQGGSSDGGLGTRLWSPLTLACSRGDLEMIQVLVEGGADVNGLDESGNSALQVAVQAGSAETIQVRDMQEGGGGNALM